MSASGIITAFEHNTFLQLRVRGSQDVDMDTNRIGLKAENISFTTGRTVPSYPIPMAGVVTGESLTMAMDLGMAQKTINVSGIITEQIIAKKFDGKALPGTTTSDVRVGSLQTKSDGADVDFQVVRVKMTSFEIAQLIHSYVDSSFKQEHQNLNELIILVPSRVGKDYEYHSTLTDATTAEATDIDDLPIIPFGYYVRDKGYGGHALDAAGVIWSPGVVSSFPNIVTQGSCSAGGEYTTEEQCIAPAVGGTWTPASDITGIGGFIRNFNTTFVGGQPWVDFTLDFEVAQLGLI
jgi:hypothetical protein